MFQNVSKMFEGKLIFCHDEISTPEKMQNYICKFTVLHNFNS